MLDDLDWELEKRGHRFARYAADTPSPFIEFDKRLRRRLRQVRRTEWKRAGTRRRKLRALGLSEREAPKAAGSRHGPWRLAGSPPLQRALPNAYWQALGLQCFSQPYRRFREALRTAGCGPACPVVW